MAPIYPPPISLCHIETISQYVTLPPIAFANPHAAICASVFGPLLLSYYPPVRGFILAYQNVTLSDEPPVSQAPRKSHKRKRSRREAENGRDGGNSEGTGETILIRHVDEYSALFMWVTAELLVWRPARGMWIEAKVTHQSTTHITLSHLNAFTISVLKQNLPSSWTFYIPPDSARSKVGGDKTAAGQVGGGGFWTDEEGLSIGDMLSVRIVDWNARSGVGEQGKGFMKIDGSLVTEEEERAALERVRIQEEERDKRLKSALRRQSGNMGGEEDDEW